MTIKIAVLLFRSKRDVSENKYTLLLKRMNVIQIWN